MKKYIYLLIIAGAVLFNQGCENNNAFSWATGSSSSITVETMLSDGDKALQKEDYEQALEIYDEILKSNPDNSEALYGKAVAEIKNADLDLSHIISAVTDDQASDPVDALLKELNIDQIIEATDNATEALKKIADGNADGTIPADDADVNINLAAFITLNATADLVDKYDVNTVEDLDQLDVSDSDIDDTVDSLEEGKSYAQVALGSDHELIEMFDEAITNIEDLKSP
ncbi:MAG: tetratricopeptide repeat protein [Elusimicrobiota bacterium]